MADEAEPSGSATGSCRGGVEYRHGRDAPAIELQIAGNRIQAIQRELLTRDVDPEPGSLTRQPERAPLVTTCRGAVRSLRIPCGQPSLRARPGIVKRSRDSSTHGIQNVLWLSSS
jgi:hypothetical protein